jgi:hypothetical protein
METLGKEKKEQKEQKKFFCKKCNFMCSKKFNLDRHILTSKHLEEHFGKEQKEQKEQKYICICGKKYSNASGLWKHKQKCNLEDKKVNEIDKDELIITLLKQNAKLMEILENGSNV